MTHSLFCLYVLENYKDELAKRIIENRANLMERRGYPKFRKFNDILINSMKNNEETIYDSYGILIRAMKEIE